MISLFSQSKKDWEENFAIACVSCAVILYQILMTRILSVVLWYHWAFLTISLALLGTGVSGVWFTLKKPGARALPVSLLLAGAAIPISLLLIFHLGQPGAGKKTLALCVISMLTPMLLLGASTCLLLIQAHGRSFGPRYASDLAGAALGAAAVIPLMHLLPTPKLIVLTGLLPLTALAVLSPLYRSASLRLSALLIALIFMTAPFKLPYSKGYKEPPGTVLYEKWSPTARLSVLQYSFFRPNGKLFGWGMGSKYAGKDAQFYWIEQDGTAGTPINHFKGNREDLSYLTFDVTAAAYLLRPPQKAAIIGPGGGRDILSAYFSETPEIDAIELNPYMVQTLSGPFKDFSGDVYHLPGVQTILSEGRSYLTRTKNTYDLIQISLIDSWTATAAGAFALSENNLYTVESFRLYWEKLNPKGLISISRWFHVESPTLAILAREALIAAGIEKPLDHIVFLKGDQVVTLLLSKSPFTPEDMITLQEICDEKGFQILFPLPPGEKQNKLSETLNRPDKHFVKDGLRFRAPTDNQPFFFHVVPIFSSISLASFKDYAYNEIAVLTLRNTIKLVSALTFLFFFLPFFLFPKGREKGPGFWRGSFYFTSIGLAFMLIEMPWIQRFILYLGHPSHALTAVLTSLLLGAGAGSLMSTRIPLLWLQRAGFSAALVLGLLNLGMGGIFRATLGWDFPLRIAVTFAMILPPAFLMGLFLPLGLLRFGEDHKAWFWALNGTASVLASVFSLALSMEFGFFQVGNTGVFFYLLAWLLLREKTSARIASL